MCNKCLKRSIGIEIVNAQSKLENVWKKVEADPTNLKNDPELIRLLDCMATLLKKYENI